MGTICSIFAPSFVPSGLSGTGGGWNTGTAFVPGGPGNINSVVFWKDPTDTGTHIGSLWSEAGSTLLGQVTFTGETASGWQTQNFASPIAVTGGTRYRIAVTHNVAMLQTNGYAPPAVKGLVPDANGVYVNNGTVVYPGSSFGACYYADVVADLTLPPTSLVVSQVLAEEWQSAGALGVSQVLAETWITRTPPTADVVSQVLAEAWISRNAPAETLVVSQALAEVWVAAPKAQRLRLSAQVI